MRVNAGGRLEFDGNLSEGLEAVVGASSGCDCGCVSNNPMVMHGRYYRFTCVCEPGPPRAAHEARIADHGALMTAAADALDAVMADIAPRVAKTDLLRSFFECASVPDFEAVLRRVMERLRPLGVPDPESVCVYRNKCMERAERGVDPGMPIETVDHARMLARQRELDAADAAGGGGAGVWAGRLRSR